MVKVHAKFFKFHEHFFIVALNRQGRRVYQSFELPSSLILDTCRHRNLFFRIYTSVFK